MDPKSLWLPPGYEGDIPDGYFVAKSQAFGNWVVWRGFQVDGSTKSAVKATKSKFRIYPLSRKDNPPKMKFINVSGTTHNTIHRMDFGYWEELDEAIQAEPVNGLSLEIRGLLTSIGIEKGKPFNPDARMKKILTEAANIGSVIARALTARPKEEMFYKYPGERAWTNPFIEGRYDFILNGATLLDSRVYMHLYATGITPAMAIANIGKGWNTIFRLYGPLGSFYDKTWKPSDPELVADE